MVDAAEIIGRGSPGDYGLSPLEHAEQLKASAPELAALLTRSGPVELARQYAEADTEALVAERTFKRWVSRANWAVLGTATVSALLMAVALVADGLDELAKTRSGEGMEGRRWRPPHGLVSCSPCRNQIRGPLWPESQAGPGSPA